jgi:hypothetical protein
MHQSSIPVFLIDQIERAGKIRSSRRSSKPGDSNCGIGTVLADTF